MPLSDWFRRAPAAPSAPAEGRKDCARCRITLPEAALFCFLCGQAVTTARVGSPLDGGDDAVVAALRERLVRAVGKRYRVHDLLGKGGMGVVFLADEVRKKRKVAIKVLRPEISADAMGVARFEREASIAASLEHPGIIPIIRVGSEQGLHFFVMEYIAGRSLDQLLQEHRDRGERLAVPAVTRILREAAAALHHAHGQGVVHRDVKPANIVLDESGRVRLADFGISKSGLSGNGSSGATTVAKLTESGTVLGTPHYLAPEQALSHRVDGRADQYALAIVGYEMLTGSVPFDDETPHAIIHRHINEAPPQLAALRPDVPAHVSAAISRALLKAPGNRYATMEDFARAIDGKISGSAAAIRRRRKIAFAVVAAALVAAAIAAAAIPRLDAVRRALGLGG